MTDLPDTKHLDDAINAHFGVRAEASHRLAALYAARGVAALRDQFPTAEYAWIEVHDVGDSTFRPAVDICRVLDANGVVLWDSGDDVEEPDDHDRDGAPENTAASSDAEMLAWVATARADFGTQATDRPHIPVEIESTATDAFAEATEHEEGWYAHSWDDVPAAAGEPPATQYGVDPSLVRFSGIDARAAAVLAKQPVDASTTITFGEGAHDVMVDMLQRAAAGGWVVRPVRDDGTPAHDIQLEFVDGERMYGRRTVEPDSRAIGPVLEFTWIEYPHVHIY